MSKLFVVICLGLVACNYDVGECYLRGEGDEGAGGSIITPTGGDGAFGHVPARPQNAPVGSGDSEAMAGCTPDCKEVCKEKCDKIHDLCHENCTKHDPTQSCRKKCNDEYASCLRDCDRNC